MTKMYVQCFLVFVAQLCLAFAIIIASNVILLKVNWCVNFSLVVLWFFA